ncbi:hypothetical protein C8J56DRAFT_1056806 [Mycena floridula]|nr:hypothetical protein C8J56DRAFT_1056806 [Mycena floridula]
MPALLTGRDLDETSEAIDHVSALKGQVWDEQSQFAFRYTSVEGCGACDGMIRNFPALPSTISAPLRHQTDVALRFYRALNYPAKALKGHYPFLDVVFC